MEQNRRILTRIGLALIVFPWFYFLMTWFRETFFPPLWVMADPASGVAGTNLKIALVASVVGGILILIDHLNSQRE